MISRAHHKKELKHVVISILVLFFIVFSLSTRVSAVQDNENSTFIDKEISNGFGNQTKVKVIINLKDNIDQPYSSIQVKKGNRTSFHKKRINDVNNTQYKVLQSLPLSDFEIIDRLQLSPTFSGYITIEGLNKLKNNPNVKSIYAEKKTVHSALDKSVPLIRVRNDVWDLGYTGVGQTICVIDSGVDYTHPALGGCNRTSDINTAGCNKVIGGRDFVPSPPDNDPFDEDGHGTHVTGVIISSNETYKGIAFGSKITAVRVLDENGSGTSTDLAQGIEWCILNADALNISVISMSLSIDGPYNSECNNETDSVEDQVNLAYNNGIFVAIASGNDGFKRGINRPACAFGAVSVGATYDEDLGIEPDHPKVYLPANCRDDDAKIDDITCFTNRNTSLDLLAPGCRINSTNLSATPFDYGCGTSQAVPHVSGAAALLLQKNNSLTPDEIEDLLKNTGKDIYDADTKTSYPRIDVRTAIARLDSIIGIDYTIDGKVYDQTYWKQRLNISSNMSGKIVSVELTWSTEDQLNLTLIEPNSNSHKSSLNRPQRISITNPSTGIWTIIVNGTNVKNSNRYVNFTIETSSQSTPGSPPQGINFTFTKLNYISACNNSNEGLTVVLKGESNSSKPIVDVSNKTNMTSKSFLAGLIIPNHKMLVNLPLGKVDVDTFLAHTETGRVMLDADVKLKFSAFNTQASIDEYKSIIQQLYSLYEQSPYVSEIKNSGYDGFPQWEAATWISPNSLKAEGEGCKIFLTNTTLKVESKLKWSYSNIDGFNVRQEAKDDINSRFNSWKGNLSQWLNNNAQRAQSEVNSDTKYDDLRYVYASVALAQWYKTLDRSQILFGDIIDSNDIYTYDLNISFDKAYWEGQANQRITENINLNSCFKQGWTSCYAWIYGGVVYINLNTNITSALNNDTKQVISNAVSTVYSQKADENNSFFYTNFTNESYYGNLTIGNVTIYFLIDFTKYSNIEFGINFSIFEDYSEGIVNDSIDVNRLSNQTITENITIAPIVNLSDLNSTNIPNNTDILNKSFENITNNSVELGVV